MDRKTYYALRVLFPDVEPKHSSEQNRLTWISLIDKLTGFVDTPVEPTGLVQLLKMFGYELRQGPSIDLKKSELIDRTLPAIDPNGIAQYVADFQAALESSMDNLRVAPSPMPIIVTAASPFIAQLLYELRHFLGSQWPADPLPDQPPEEASESVGREIISHLLQNPAVAAEYASYAAWAALDEVRPENEATLNARFDKHFDSANAQVSELTGQLENVRQIMETALNGIRERYQDLSDDVIARQKESNDLSATIRDSENQIRQLIEQIDGANATVVATGERTDAVNKKIEAVDSNYDAFTRAIEARFKIQAPKELWDQRARSTGRAFYASVALLIVMLILVPGVALYKYEVLIQAVQRISDSLISIAKKDSGAIDLSASQLTVVTINRLLFIAFPLALYVWAVRLLVRYAMRSLALMDDAQMRQTVVDSYYRLNADHQLSPEDGRLMLTALFRPAPGQAADSTDFPDVIEFVNKATPKG